MSFINIDKKYFKVSSICYLSYDIEQLDNKVLDVLDNENIHLLYRIKCNIHMNNGDIISKYVGTISIPNNDNQAKNLHYQAEKIFEKFKKDIYNIEEPTRTLK